MPRFRALAAPAAFALAATLAAPVARAAAPGGAPADPAALLGALALVLLGARLGGAAFERIGQPAVLGELAAGIVLGNLGLLGVHALDGLRSDPAIDWLAQIGVLVLLFEIGLGSDLRAIARVGASAGLVAALGVVAPLVLGALVSRWFFPSHAPVAHAFVGATLTATSVGLTARVLADLGRTASVEGRIVLGAAVIDDVLGLLALGVVSALARAANGGAAFDAGGVALAAARALAFLAAAVLLGRGLSRAAFAHAARLPGRATMLPLALAFCFALALLAARAGLAPIVGAFAAGLVMDETHVEALRARDPRGRGLAHLLEPVSGFLAPVFFVVMGARVDLSALREPRAAAFALVLAAAAIAGKQLCALGVLERGADRIAVGLAMVPRGEVGLIFAAAGAALRVGGAPVVDPAVYAGVVAVVAATTLVTPPLLALRLRRSRGAG